MTTQSTPVTFEIRSVYGNLVAYPANELAQGFAAIAGTKTLTRATLLQILKMGFELCEVDRRGNVSKTFDARIAQYLPAVA